MDHTLYIWLMMTHCVLAMGQVQNLPPRFIPGGDMEGFSLKEDTPIGSSVYTLRGDDPEGTDITFSVSGDYLSVDRTSGVVTLVKSLDRETQSQIEVIITVTDGRIFGLEPNTVPIRRLIPVTDVNDNRPVFQKEPYSFQVLESVSPGATLYSDIIITDEDEGTNSEITLTCIEEENPKACNLFDIRSAKTPDGPFVGIVSLKAPLDYEEQTKFDIKIKAEDGGGLFSISTIHVKVSDVQDRAPILLNAPYSTTIKEGTPPGKTIFKIIARDGDVGKPQPIRLSLTGDDSNYFTLGETQVEDDGTVTASILTGQNPVDRESSIVAQNGGIYSFNIRADEIRGKREYTQSKIQIVVDDADDQKAKFSHQHASVNVSEKISDGTPLPGLNLIVKDEDLGENSRFQLSLENGINSKGIFEVFPTSAIGQASVLVKVVNASAFDYENPESSFFSFKVIATQHGQQVAEALVNVSITDANDNAPNFPFPSYRFSVPEGASPGTVLSTIVANDSDSGDFGKVTYSLRGFGSEKFKVNAETGEFIVSNCGIHITCIDYERQTLYSLTYSATDGGGLVTSVNIFVDVIDQNDNAPVFDQVEYKRIVDEKTEFFDPPLAVQATDIDGPGQGGGKIEYSIQTGNTNDEVFSIDSTTGELSIQRPLTHMDTPSSIYTLVIRATDAGVPARHSDVRVMITVGRDKNRPPRFSRQIYYAQIPETAVAGTNVKTIKARDPDGNDEDIVYKMGLGGGADHFNLDEKTGHITVSPTAALERDVEPSYLIEVLAIDSGKTTQQTSTATVNVTLTDINNQSPVFEKMSYRGYVNERAPIGNSVLLTEATDSDVSANLIYTIVEPIFAYDKTGQLSTDVSNYNFKEAFKVNKVTGEISVAEKLDHNEASIIVMTIQVNDTNAHPSYPNQIDTTEVSIYIQIFSDKNPIFPSPWTPERPYVMINLKEEEPVDESLFSVAAKDPMSGHPVRRYQKVRDTDLDNIFNVDPLTGDVSLNRKLDYELEDDKRRSFKVLAIADDRVSEASVMVNLTDVNDNNPIFSENEYHTRLSEDARWPKTVMQVSASDADTGDSGTVRYSIGGADKLLFVINETTGDIQVARGAQLDREKSPVVTLEISAFDTPSGAVTRRKTTVLVKIELIDVNDEVPKWTNDGKYTSVIAENVDIGTEVVRVHAEDPDLGLNGIVSYVIPELQPPINGVFDVDSETGVVTVKSSLKGKGRSRPYEVKVRAVDGGELQQFSEAMVSLFIGDVSKNDGVPVFIQPQPNETATVMENSRTGTAIYQVEAIDSDSSETQNGKIVYSLLENAISNRPFQINPSTGLITVKDKLDRETKAQYSVVIIAQDLGQPPQVASRTLTINITDADDNDPVFQKVSGKEVVTLEVEEEAAAGTIVGYVSAEDRDVGGNALIDYAITYGNDEGLLGINRTEDNQAMIYVKGRIDREKISEIVLTVACAKLGQRLPERQEYISNDPTLLKVVIQIRDLDDNRPVFEKSSITTGIRIDVPLQTQILQVYAEDMDPTSEPIKYSLYNASVLHVKEVRDMSIEEKINETDVFLLEESTGILRTRASLKQFSGDVFTVFVAAVSQPTDRPALAKLTLYILRDRDLLRFIFDKQPKEIRTSLSQFKSDVERTLPVKDPINLYDAAYYTDATGKVDYEKTSSCFQLIGRSVDETKKLFNAQQNKRLKDAFQKYSVLGVESCLPRDVPRAYVDWVEIWVLIIAALIGIATIVTSCVLCFLYSRYKQRVRRTTNQLRLLENPQLASQAPSVIPGSIIMLPQGPPPPITMMVPETPSNGHQWHERGMPMDQM